MEKVDNDFYDTLGEGWYRGGNHPVALLRAEAKLKNPWVWTALEAHCGPHARVLDVGCGAGFLANPLGGRGHRVTGIDLSLESLRLARAHDESASVRYLQADALALPFRDGEFDAVASMDFLEHVEDPEAAVREAARVLRPGGLFFFHTLNRSRLADWVAIRGVRWFVKNTPPQLHVLRLFVKPEELIAGCAKAGLRVQELVGCRPRLDRAFFRLLATREVPEDFTFVFTRSLQLTYLGWARRIA